MTASLIDFFLPVPRVASMIYIATRPAGPHPSRLSLHRKRGRRRFKQARPRHPVDFRIQLTSKLFQIAVPTVAARELARPDWSLEMLPDDEEDVSAVAGVPRETVLRGTYGFGDGRLVAQFRRLFSGTFFLVPGLLFPLSPADHHNSRETNVARDTISHFGDNFWRQNCFGMYFHSWFNYFPHAWQ